MGLVSILHPWNYWSRWSSSSGVIFEEKLHGWGYQLHSLHLSHKNPLLQWMEEIRPHLGWLRPYNLSINNGRNHRFQLVRDFFQPYASTYFMFEFPFIFQVKFTTQNPIPSCQPITPTSLGAKKARGHVAAMRPNKTKTSVFLCFGSCHMGLFNRQTWCFNMVHATFSLRPFLDRDVGMSFSGNLLGVTSL